MKHSICLLALAAAMLVSPAIAQESQHCYKPHSQTTVCRFSPSGRVNVTSAYDDGTYYSNWYTRSEWVRYKSNPSNIDVYVKPANVKSEAEAHSWHSQNGCEGDGFVWSDGACHARTK